MKVLAGYISGGTIRVELNRSLIGLIYYPAKKYKLIGVMDELGIYIADNRNSIVLKFLEQTDADWLIQFDSDIKFPSNTVETLLENYETGFKVISGVYNNTKYENGKQRIVPMTFRFVEESNSYKPIKIGKIPTIVDVVGAGCLLVHREVFEKFDKTAYMPWFGYEASNIMKPFGEDFTFCRRVRRLGYNIIADPRVPLVHYKVIGVEG